MRISEDVIKSQASTIADVLNKGCVCELKIEKGEIAIIEIKRKLKRV